MRIDAIKVKDPGQNELMNYQYTYDQMNNIVNKSTGHGEYTYGYDELYRLTKASNPIQDNETFSYDAVGNRLSSDGTILEWSYNANNELKGYDSVSFVYDDNGSMAQKIVNSFITKYFYNIENRLIRVESGMGEVIAKYYYDPFGRRLWKETDSIRTYFHYADEGLIGEYYTNGDEVKAYGYRPGSMWTADPMFIKLENDYFFFQNDLLGTPIKTISLNGEVDLLARYSSFGITEIDYKQEKLNNFRFPGQYFDKETNLHYNYHRYYDPFVGRYLSEDPLGLAAGINLYSFVLNNPINLIDPFGLEVLDFNFNFPWVDCDHFPIERHPHPHPPIFGPVLDTFHYLELQFTWLVGYPFVFLINWNTGQLPPPVYPPYLPPLTDENDVRLKYKDVPWWYWIPIEPPKSDCP